jgi:hypothetical protein
VIKVKPKNKYMTKGLRERRLGVLGRFKVQLETGLKPVRKQPGETQPLTDKDRKRIEKDIAILEAHLKMD